MPSLPVISNSGSVADQLSLLDVGEVRFSRHDRLLYATDASLYQLEPLGVVIPQTIEQVENLLEFCREHRLPILPRGGGTSLAGQCTARAIVLDLSPRCTRIWDVDVANRRCKAQAGVVLDQLNRQLASLNTGLFFAPDPATTAQAVIGGCVGNNAAGARSIRYGRMSENLAGLEILLASGERFWVGPGAGRRNAAAATLAVSVAQIVCKYADTIRARIPKLVRRNAGYGLDLILMQLDAGILPKDLDLSGLLCGSEGTLAITLAAELKLHPLPLARRLAIASFESVDAAIDSVSKILATNPTCVELLDNVVLEAARGNLECNRYLSLLPDINGQPPAAVLYVEYQKETPTHELSEKFEELRSIIPAAPLIVHFEPIAMLRAWTLRKSGEALLHGLSSTNKPITFVEDNAVPVQSLSRFVREFRRIVESHGTQAAFYAHASVGVLHVRPMIDLRNSHGLKTMQAIAVEVAELARDCGGVMSGEHGDGKARGPLLGSFYGPELMQAFREIKTLFDPMNLLNPGNIIDAGPIESITQNLRVQKEHSSNAPALVETYFDYHDQEGFRSAVEMCNGAGFCRKSVGGTMCPSYRATMDERHSTRGRGNALRLAITGQASSQSKTDWNDADTIKTLDLCLSCKACKNECPSNVDISRLKAEYTAQRFMSCGIPLSARVFGHIRQFNRLGSTVPAVANWIMRQKTTQSMIQKYLHVSAKRKLPTLGPSLFKWFGRRKLSNDLSKLRVVLFGDCFTSYNEPQIGRSAVQVLEKLGYQVLLPKVGCCGRAMISVGLLKDAIRSADRTIDLLRAYIDDPDVVAIVVCEPSCLSAMKDDWLQLKLNTPIAVRLKLAEKAILVEDFVDQRWERHPRRPTIKTDAASICLHGHCHQKALWGDGTSSAILRRLSGGNVEVLQSGCCGMAGAFGYAEDKYDLSMKIGELSVFPAIRAANADTIIVAPGTSCRHQIRDGTGKEALHPIEVVARWLEDSN